MPHDIKFGATLTLAIPSNIKMPLGGMNDEFMENVLYRIKEFTKRLNENDVECIEVESVTTDEVEDMPYLNSIDYMPKDIIVAAEWDNLDVFFKDHDLITLNVRVPLMDVDNFSRIIVRIRSALVEEFESEFEAEMFNSNCTDAIIFIGSYDFSASSFLCAAPEAQWQAVSRRMGDFRATPIRQSAGVFIMRDMMLLGREAMSPHSIRSALRKSMSLNSSSLKRFNFDVYSLISFSSHKILENAILDECHDGKYPGGLKDTLDILSSFCVHKEFYQNPEDFTPHQYNQIERLYDRFAISLSWVRDNKQHIETVKSINNGEISSEGSARIIFKYKGEPAMFLSQESGWLCVPGNKDCDDFLISSGFAISDADVVFPLVALDLAEIIDHPDFSYDLPIASKAFVTALRDLQNRLSEAGLIDKWEISQERNETPNPI